MTAHARTTLTLCPPIGLALTLVCACFVPEPSDPGEGEDSSGETETPIISESEDDTPDSSAELSGDTSGRCAAAGLEWKTARKTQFTSYPDPGSPECDEFNGCMWAGLFAGCSDRRPETWVSKTNIAAVFPGFRSLEHHELCIRSGSSVMIINVIDTCSDSDCDGCCTRNQGSNDALIDLEDYTNARWGLPDGQIEWADLGPNPNPVCD